MKMFLPRLGPIALADELQSGLGQAARQLFQRG
jgi:hypothetical protein